MNFLFPLHSLKTASTYFDNLWSIPGNLYKRTMRSQNCAFCILHRALVKGFSTTIGAAL